MDKKEIKLSLSTFIVGIIAIILVFVIIIMGMYIANQNKTIEDSQTVMANKENELQECVKEKNNETVSSTNTNSTTIQQLDINSALVQKLYGYINEKSTYEYNNEYYPRWNFDTFLSYYRTKKITNTTLENDIKLITVLELLHKENTYTIIKNNELNSIYIEGYEYKNITLKDGYFYDFEAQKYIYKESEEYPVNSDVYVFSMDSIQEKAKEIFNTKIDNEKHSFVLLGTGYFYDNNTYKYFEYEGGGGYDITDITQLISAEQKGDEIYIYDNYIRAEYAVGDKYNVYATSDENIKLKELTDENEIKVVFQKNAIQKLSELGVTIPKYKHTFKKGDNETYYWVSTELINKDDLKSIN